MRKVQSLSFAAGNQTPCTVWTCSNPRSGTVRIGQWQQCTPETRLLPPLWCLYRRRRYLNVSWYLQQKTVNVRWLLPRFTGLKWPSGQLRPRRRTYSFLSHLFTNSPLVGMVSKHCMLNLVFSVSKCNAWHAQGYIAIDRTNSDQDAAGVTQAQPMASTRCCHVQSNTATAPLPRRSHA